MRTDDLDFELPDRLIATQAAEPRDSARLMVCRRNRPVGQDIEHMRVRDLPRLGLLRAGDLLVVNRTRVLPAFFEAVRDATGGRVRGLYLNSAGDRRWLVMLEARGSLQVGEVLVLGGPPSIVPTRSREPGPAALGRLVLAESRGRGTWVVAVEGELSTDALLERIGTTPLPPYIRKMRKHAGAPEVGTEDASRYNTVYAAEPGSVAAPTAGLHFTPELLASLESLGVRRADVTLDVGLGTFEPVRADTLEEHRMHRERVRVPAETLAAIRSTRASGGRILVVGTTTVRALESLPAAPPETGWQGETELFIHPEAGFTWRYTDLLMTNFHLPRSTLLAMVASLPGTGIDRLHGWYREAIEHGYRFYSYGDAMLVV